MENFNPNAQDMERIVNIPDNTPSGAIERWEKAIAEMTSGYEDSAGLDVVFQRSHNDMVISSGIAFSSICEHHLFPFFGTADVAYVPNAELSAYLNLPERWMFFLGDFRPRKNWQTRLLGIYDAF